MATKEAIKKIQDKATEDYKGRTEDLYNKSAMLEEKIINVTISLDAVSNKVNNLDIDGLNKSIEEVKSRIDEVEKILREHSPLITQLRGRIGI
tara:strand:- start:1355 stop:1633 length:279 start_codon:yes stop_codon:yes gene_type:complete